MHILIWTDDINIYIVIITAFNSEEVLNYISIIFETFPFFLPIVLHQFVYIFYLQTCLNLSISHASITACLICYRYAYFFTPVFHPIHSLKHG